MRQHCFFAFFIFVFLNFSPAFAETQKVHGFEIYPRSGQVEAGPQSAEPAVAPVQEDEPAPQPVAAEPAPAPEPTPVTAPTTETVPTTKEACDDPKDPLKFSCKNYTLPDSYHKSQGQPVAEPTAMPIEAIQAKPAGAKQSGSYTTKATPTPVTPEPTPVPVAATTSTPTPAPAQAATSTPAPAPTLAPDATAPAATEEKPIAGYDGGFFIQDKEGKFRMKIGGRLAAKYSAVFAEDVHNAHSFILKRSLFFFSGHVIDPKLTWSVVLYPLAAPPFASGSMTYTFNDHIALNFGFDSPPFNYLTTLSSKNLSFVDKSIETLRHGVGDSIGIWANGSFGRFSYTTGLFNGRDTGLGPNLNEELLYSALLTYDPIGSYSGSEGDGGYTETPALRLSLSGSFHHEETDVVTQAKVIASNAFAGFKYKGLSLAAGGSFRYTDPNIFTREQIDLGYTVQAGYYIIPKKLEIALRHSGLIDDVNNVGQNINMESGGNLSSIKIGTSYIGSDVGLDSDNEYEYSAAISWDIHNFNMRLQAQYSLIVDGIPGADELINHFVMVQSQLSF